MEGGGEICRLALFSLSPQICNEVLFCPNSTCGDVLLENTSVGFVFTSMQLLHYLIYFHMDYYFFLNTEPPEEMRSKIYYPCSFSLLIHHALVSCALINKLSQYQTGYYVRQMKQHRSQKQR